MKLNYLEQPTHISMNFLPEYPGNRTFEITEDIEVTLSDGYVLLIQKGFRTDLSSVPSWAWSIFRPIDQGFIGDLIHDALWDDKIGQIKHFNNVIYDARKFADEERLRWRTKLAPNKKVKNKITHFILRLVGGLFYSREINIPN